MEKTNITELAGMFPANFKQEKPQVIIGVPSLLKGETVAQAIARRADNARRIEAKLMEKRAK